MYIFKNKKIENNYPKISPGSHGELSDSTGEVRSLISHDLTLVIFFIKVKP